jgi:Ras-related protein Rab-22
MLLGDIGVGKTSLARRLVFGRFEADYKATIGVDIYTHEVLARAQGETLPVTLIIWDVDGDFGESIFKHAYIRGASAALIISDRTRPSTLTSMFALADRFEDTLPGRPYRLIVNKSDLSSADTNALSRVRAARQRTLLNTSAKSGENVGAAFETLATELISRGL